MAKSIGIQFDKINSPWQALLETVDKKIVKEVGTIVVAAFDVKQFSLEDHQFVRVTVATKNGRETTFYIPRNIVFTIVEGEDLLDKIGFAGKK